MTLRWMMSFALAAGLLSGGSLTVQAQGTGKAVPAKAAEKPPPAAKKTGPAAPASVREATTVVDLRTLATLKEAEFNTHAATRLEGRASADVKPAAEFYLAQLTKLGWKPSVEPNSQMITDDYAQAALEKNGFALALSVMPGRMPGQVTVSVINLGNLDSRELPRVADAKSIYGGRASAMYVTPRKVADVAAETRKLLKAAGWAEYAQPFSRKAEIPDQEMFELRQRGVSMTAYISVAPAQKGQTAIQYSTRMLRQELPAPANAEALEFDDHRPYLRCQIPGEMQGAIDFFSKALPEIGYSEKRSANATGDGAFLVFRSPEKDVALAELKKLDGDKIDATVRELSRELEGVVSQRRDHDADLRRRCNLGDRAEALAMEVDLALLEDAVEDGHVLAQVFQWAVEVQSPCALNRRLVAGPNAELEPSALLVPDSAVLRSGEKNTVFVALGEGRFEPREVTLGPRADKDAYEVLDGLKEGERVVTSGQFMFDSESQLQEAVQKMLNPNAKPTAAPDHSVHPAPEKIVAGPSPELAVSNYVCPMPEHASIKYNHGGKCPICGMTLIPAPAEEAEATPATTPPQPKP